MRSGDSSTCTKRALSAYSQAPHPVVNQGTWMRSPTVTCSFGLRSVGQSVLKFAIACAALAVVVYVLIHWPGLYSGGSSRKVVALAVTIAAATGTYFLMSLLLRSQELGELREVRRTGREDLL